MNMKCEMEVKFKIIERILRIARKIKNISEKCMQFVQLELKIHNFCIF